MDSKKQALDKALDFMRCNLKKTGEAGTVYDSKDNYYNVNITNTPTETFPYTPNIELPPKGAVVASINGGLFYSGGFTNSSCDLMVGQYSVDTKYSIPLHRWLIPNEEFANSLLKQAKEQK